MIETGWRHGIRYGSHMDTPDRKKIVSSVKLKCLVDRAKYRINNNVMFNEQLMKETG